ncbi:2-oxoacid dehydrogenases acyltransferase-domain-containing protein [Pelagophyceae sp. CCMP2097]|nr:2-oxoacid dehydrogenases acyltransferase-domain-containing protein [Pelagophyceae sp. CCMP2097]
MFRLALRCTPSRLAVAGRRWLSYPKHEVVGLPALSPTMEAGTIAVWKVVEGAGFSAGDVLCEIETDKATVDFEAQDGGVLAKILVLAGSEVAVGAPIAVLVEEASDAPAFADYTADAPAAAPAAAAAPASAAGPAVAAPRGDAQLMPAASFLANSKKIDVTALKGSGKGGRITKGDVLVALAAGTVFPALPQASAAAKAAAMPVAAAKAAPVAAPAAVAAVSAAAAPAVGARQPWQNEPRVAYDVWSEPNSGAPYVDTPATGMRKIISKRLTESRAFVPHSYTTSSVELDAVSAMRKALARDFDVKVSINDVVIRACALALRDVPRANSSWDGATCVPNASVDISVAVATPTGLITPIVTNAASKGLTQISAEVRDLATRARLGKLKPHEYQGGTFSISNLGMFGIQEFSAVINPPQACILAVGGGVQEVVPGGDGEPKLVTKMTSRLSSDRRVVDEALAAQFMQVFSYYMANPRLLAL